MAQNYIPSLQNIIAITQSGKNAIVQTETDHFFVIGNVVKFLIPSEYKMTQLNDMQANVISTTADTITVDINISEFTPFFVPGDISTPAQVVPLGSTNFGFETQGTIPDPITISGAFRITEI